MVKKNESSKQPKPQPTFADTVRQHFLGKKVWYGLISGQDIEWWGGILEDANSNALMIRASSTLNIINPAWVSTIREE